LVALGRLFRGIQLNEVKLIKKGRGGIAGGDVFRHEINEMVPELSHNSKPDIFDFQIKRVRYRRGEK
jgi:hypothetical protein